MKVRWLTLLAGRVTS